MKTKIIIALLAIGLFLNKATAQTIAVSDFSTTNIFATPEIVAKLARIELIKTNKYVVMDESDMEELLSPDAMIDCYGKQCLIKIGETLKIPYILSGSIDGLGNKIVISIKLIDVVNKSIKYSKSMEFDNQEDELQRMIGIVINEMHNLPINEEIKKQLIFKNELIISTNVDRVNNSGPRMGVAFLHKSELNEFFRRSENQGGLGIKPIFSNLGYQFEGQYIGTEKFSALAEVILNIGGMEQGQFIPSFALLNGFRFGTQGWEFAFGPSFGLRKTSKGFFTESGKNLFGKAAGSYWTFNEFVHKGYTNKDLKDANYEFSENLDKRGTLKINTNWLMAFGRTFKAGALNIPVNIYYSYNKYGGSIGTSVGFNVTNRKFSIN